MKRTDDDDRDGPAAGRSRRARRAPAASNLHAIADAYSWDERRSEDNRSKHAIAFETAVLVFEDPRQVTAPTETVHGEQRWQTVGMASPGLMLLVIHTRLPSSPDRIHIISARRVTKTERVLFDSVKSGHSRQILGHTAGAGGRAWFGPRGYRRPGFAKRRAGDTE